MEGTETGKQKTKKKPSLKQRKALDIMVENGGNVSRAMREAGYSPATAENPSKLTEAKGFQELLAEKLNDELLTKVHLEGLAAYRISSGAVIGGDVGIESVDVQTPDFAVRHKYLETAYKIRDKMPKDGGSNTAIQVNVGQVNILPEVLAEADKILKEKLLSRKPNDA
jgi:hypothetical protein